MPTNVDLLNEGLGLEQFAIAAYEGAISTGLLSENVKNIARKFQSQHGDHAHKLRALITELGGEPVKPLSSEEYLEKIPKEALTSEVSLVQFASHLEKLATIDFLRQVSEIDDRKMAQAIASISADEAMHWATLRSTLGKDPVPVSFIPLSENEVED